MIPWLLMLAVMCGAHGAYADEEQCAQGGRLPYLRTEYLDDCAQTEVRAALNEALQVLNDIPEQCTRIAHAQKITSFEAQHALVQALLALDVGDDTCDSPQHKIFTQVLTLLAKLSKRAEDMV